MHKYHYGARWFGGSRDMMNREMRRRQNIKGGMGMNGRLGDSLAWAETEVRLDNASGRWAGINPLHLAPADAGRGAGGADQHGVRGALPIGGAGARVLTHGLLLQRVWGPERTGEGSLLRNVVRKLRRKLG